MKITSDTPDLLILRWTRWKGALLMAVLTLLSLWIGTFIAADPDKGIGILLIWLGLTVSWTVPFALFGAERSMLILNATTGEAELRHRTPFGFHCQTWPLAEVQSTRVTRIHTHGPAIEDKKRRITLYVRIGMDEGRHRLVNGAIPADAALAASARVSDWMRGWRKTNAPSLDSTDPQA